jgi:hypothetical protein
VRIKIYILKHINISKFYKGPSWSWSYDGWIYNYLCNQCLSPLTLCSPYWTIQLWLRLGLGFWRHFQQYFSYIVTVSFIGGENHRPAASHWQTLSHNVMQFLTSMCNMSVKRDDMVIFRKWARNLTCYYKHTAFNWGCYGRLPYSEHQYHPEYESRTY